MSEENLEIPLGTLSYGETRTISIGNYESVKCELRYHTRVRPINNKEFVLETTHMEVDRIKEGQTFNDTAKLLVHRVKSVLNARETDVRMRTAKFIEDFLPEEKILLQKLIGLKSFREKSKKFAVEQAEIKDYFKSTDDDGFDDEVEI